VAGLIDEAFERREDPDFLLRVAQEFDFDIVKQLLVRKHVGHEYHLGQDHEAGKAANERFRQKHIELAEELDMRTEMESALEFSLGRTSLATGNCPRAIRYFLRSLSYDLFNMETLLHLCASLGGPVTHRLGKWVNDRL
jgi:FAD synthase